MEKNVKKIILTAVLFTVAVVVFTACNKKTEKVEEVESDSIVIVEEIRVLKDYTAYAFEEKDEVLADAKAELKRFNKKIDELKAEADTNQQELSAEAKAEYDDAVKELEQIRDAFKAKKDELENSTAETWEEAKTNSAEAYNVASQEIENTIKKAKSAISNTAKEIKNNVNRSIDSLQKK